MSTAIAFLSGKGGSGKTTLSLSIADLLSRCEIRTLLVDCDISTNGATYFYESRLNRKSQDKSKFCSFLDVLNLTLVETDFCPIHVNPYYDFFPSISNFSAQKITWDSVPSNNVQKSHLKDFLILVKENYEVILFDCQAGYSSFLSELLPMMDIDVFVLEADSISASAMRNLHLKAGNYFGDAKLYQVFNKATKEEFDIYSKIDGTFFTNIGTLLFDWRIRQAFSRSQIPDMENSSAEYGADLCEICRILLPDDDTKNKLNEFLCHIQYLKSIEKRQQIEIELNNLKPEHSFEYSHIFTLILSIIASLGSIVVFNNMENGRPAVIIALIISFILMVTIIISFTGTSLSYKNKRKEYEKKLYKLNKTIEELDRNRKKNK